MAAVQQHPHVDNGARIRRARERIRTTRLVANHRPDRPISQQDFADLVGVSLRQLIRLENGQHLPSGELRDRIVEETGTEEKIESRDDDEEAHLLPRVLLDRIATKLAPPELSWRAVHPNATGETARRLRRDAYQDLLRASAIEESLK